eukprot:scaffold35761_cov56-Phaeocystis_antarctica.AAC.2
MSPRAVALCACAATVYGFTARAAPRHTPTPRRGHAALRRAAFPHGGCMVGVGMACIKYWCC